MPNTVYDKESSNPDLPEDHSNTPVNAPSDEDYDRRQRQPAGKSSDPRDDPPAGEEAANDEARFTRNSLANAEQFAGMGSGKFSPRASLRDRLSTLWGSPKRKKALIGGGVAGGILTTGIFLLSVVSGPMEFVHFAMLLHQFHLQSNEDFSDDRSTKTMLYALAGRGVERTRLGIPGNRAADVWEKQLLKSTGLRPVYSETTRRFVGFEIVDENKAFDALNDASESKNGKAVEQAMGKGAEIRTAGEASAGKQRIVRGGSGGILDSKTRIIDLSDVKSFAEQRQFIRTIGKLTGTKSVVSAAGSRLLIKRAGVDFHPLKNIKRKAGDKLADYRQKVKDEKAQRDATGVESADLTHNDAKDQNGNPQETPADSAATDTADEAIKEASSGVGRDVVKSAVQKMGKGGAVLGVLCATQAFGDNIPKYKYTNIVLPMIRVGMGVVTMGNQVMSNQDVNMDELGAFSENLHDPKTGKSWIDANSILAEEGQKQTGVNPPAEVQLGNINDKPVFFDAIDKIPFLGTTCSVSGALGHLPIIKQVSNVGSGAVVAALNVVANQFGTSVDKIVEGALAAVAGKAVNTEASGPDLGNIANIGTFYAANNIAATNGGVPLTDQQVAELQASEAQTDKAEETSKSVASRYFDLYDPNSLASKVIDSTPPPSEVATSFASHAASFFNGGLNSLASSLLPKTHAAAKPFNYGAPKLGFSLEDQSNPEFENPYDNAQIIEKPGVLDQLNEKYGKVCFGMTVTADDTGVHVSTDGMDSDGVNMFQVYAQHSDVCDPKNNKDPMFLRYRFYLADSMAAESLDCFEGGQGDEQSCQDIGVDSGASSDTATTDTAGTTIDTSKLYQDSTSVACADGTKDLGTQDGYTNGNKVKIRICAVSNLPGSGQESNGGYGVSGADGKAVVNSRVSGAVYAMVEAAKKDGVNLTANSAFRTMAHQQALCPCDGVTVARPGYSNHQMGLAIDFGGGLPSTPGPIAGNQFWDWLSKKAGDFGYKNYPREAWHWSPTGN